MLMMSTSNMRASFKEKLERISSAIPPRRKPPPHPTEPVRRTLDIWEFVQIDTRPLFVLDKTAAAIHRYVGDLRNAIVYMNRAFEILSGSVDLEVMVLKFLKTQPGHATYVAGRVWGNYSIASGKFLVCTGDSVAITEGGEYNHWGAEATSATIHRESTKDMLETRERATPTHQLLDWTRYSASIWLPQHYRQFIAVKWKNTSVGSTVRWSSAMRAIVNSVMVHPYQTVLYWGPKYAMIYNEPYVQACKNRHPDLLGKSLENGWPELYAKMGQYLEKTMHGHRFAKLADVLPVDRENHDEECYFNWILTPIIEKGGNVAGALWQQNEVTARVLHARRQSMLKALRACTAIARCPTNFWAAVLEGFDSNTYDSPFVVMYDILRENDNEAVLLGTRGVPTGHVIAPKVRIIGDSDDLFSEEIQKVRVMNKRCMKHDLMGYDFMMEISGRGWQAPCKSAAVIPIHSSDDEKRVEAVIILGINPRRPFDTDYEIWLDQVQEGITGHLADLRSLEASVQKVVKEKIEGERRF